MHDDLDPEMTVINYDAIIKSNWMCSIVKFAAQNAQRNPYSTIGDFFKMLSNSDVAVLQDMVEHAEHDDYAQKNLVALSEILSRCEGVIASSIDDCVKNVNTLCLLVTCVSLARKGAVKVFYENMSFGSDAGERPIVEKI